MRVRYLVLLSVGAILFALTGAITGRAITTSGPTQASEGRSWGIASATLKGKLNRDGSVEAEQTIGAYFNGSFTGFYQDIPFNQGNQIAGLNAGDSERLYKPGGSAELGSTGEPGSWGATYLPGEVVRVVWHHQTANTSRNFKLYYTINNVGESFENRDALRVRVWGQYWPAGAERVAAQFKLPTSAGVQAQAAPWFVRPETQVRGDTVTMIATKVPAKQSVDLLITMPKGTLLGVKSNTGPVPSVAQSGSSLQEKYGYSNLKRGLAWLVAYLLLTALPVTLWMLLWKRRLRDSDYLAQGRQYETPPGSMVYGYVAAEESLPDLSRAMTATLIDLVARGYFTRENVRGEDGEWRLKIGIQDEQPAENAGLSQGEQATLEYFNSLLAQGPCIVDDLDSRVSQSKESLARVNQVHSALLEDMKAGQAGQKSRSGIVKGLAFLWALFALPAGAALTFTLPMSHLLGAPFFIGVGFTLVLATIAIASWPKGDFTLTGGAGMATAGPWRSYRDFILSFSSMETAPDLQVELWERAFAAALIFGVAREFSERAKVLVPNLGEDMTAFSTTTYYSAALGSSISSAATPPSSSSSGSGGGFSGGGMGGGGGGAW